MKFVLKNAGAIGRIGLMGRIGIKCKLSGYKLGFGGVIARK